MSSTHPRGTWRHETATPRCKVGKVMVGGRSPRSIEVVLAPPRNPTQYEIIPRSNTVATLVLRRSNVVVKVVDLVEEVNGEFYAMKLIKGSILWNSRRVLIGDRIGPSQQILNDPIASQAYLRGMVMGSRVTELVHHSAESVQPEFRDRRQDRGGSYLKSLDRRVYS
ncbi:hypothetical protein F4818DRAFT_311771 [Hypoxylon cercidicola]|nr:hypothetical protein F4818DRAFT_311771 [Hypoxylon cercidicola]